MLISNIFLIVSFYLFLPSYAISERIFFNGLCFSSHCTLVSSNLVRFDKDSIGRYLHTLCYRDEVSYQEKVNVKLKCDSISFYGHLLLFICNWVETHELSLFLIVIDGSYHCADEYGNQNSKPFYPSLCPFFGFGCTCLKYYGQDSSDQ